MVSTHIGDDQVRQVPVICTHCGINLYKEEILHCFQSVIPNFASYLGVHLASGMLSSTAMKYTCAIA